VPRNRQQNILIGAGAKNDKTIFGVLLEQHLEHMTQQKRDTATLA
jgi:hypothetical protein